MGRFKVVEIFTSINGEGQRAGELATFVRFAGCNLNCSYCDTKWANQEGAPYDIMSEEEIYSAIKESGVRNVTLTGGEPLLRENMDRLLKLLGRDKELRVEIETNGAVDIKPFSNLSDNISFTLDYKLPGSGVNDRMIMENYQLISPKDTVKFVVSDREDLDKAREIIDEYKLCDRAKVYLSSAFGAISPEDIVEYMKEYNMNEVKLQLQLHKYIWDPDRKGV